MEKQWYDVAALARFTELDERLIRQYLAENMLPRPLRLSPKKLAWHADELPYLLWILKHVDRYGPSKPGQEEED